MTTVTRTLKNLIGGVWLDSGSEEMLEAIDPRTGEAFARFPAGSPADVDAAVSAARAAQPGWAALSLEERIAALTAFIEQVEAHQELLAAAESREMGKPLPLARQFLAMAIDSFRSSLADAARYPFRKEVRGDRGVTEIIRTPVGVVALIVPWNFPMVSVLSVVATLLVVGNTVVLKPSEKSTPSAVELLKLSALPAGVLNLVLGDGRCGGPLAAHPGVGLVHFTGSVATGRRIGEAAGGNLTRAVLELGGKDAAVVDSGVDPVETAKAVAYGAFTNTGQICTAVERVYVHEEIAPAFIDALVEAAAEFAPGGAQEMGPLIDERQREIVIGQVRDALEKGATVLTGGEAPEGPGFHYPPTVLTGVDHGMTIMTEETFGPVVAVDVVPDFAEGLRRAADTRYGLAASVFTRDPGHVRMAGSLPVAMVSVNEWLGSDGLGVFEPAGISGLGIVGAEADFDAATRPVSVFVPDGTVGGD